MKLNKFDCRTLAGGESNIQMFAGEVFLINILCSLL